jgi:hypothetical protein
MAFMRQSVTTYVAILEITYDLTWRGMAVQMSRGNVTRSVDNKLGIALNCIALTGSRYETDKWPVFEQLHRPHCVAGIHTWRLVGCNT